MHAHPRLAMPPENRFVRESYLARARFGDLAVEANRVALATWITTTPGTRFTDLNLRRRSIVDAIAARGTTIGAANGIVLRAYARRHGKARWGEKRPAYWHDVAALLRMFPHAQVVHLVRDPRSCVSSLKNVPWYTGDVMGAVSTWLLAQERIRRDARRLGPDAYHELHFEDLARDPAPSLTELCRFLDEDFDPAMLHHEQAAEVIVPPWKSWHALTHEPIDDARVTAWHTGLTPDELGLVERVAGAAMHRHGYQPSGAGTPPTTATVARFTAGHARRDLYLRRQRLKDAARRGWYRGAVADPEATAPASQPAPTKDSVTSLSG